LKGIRQEQIEERRTAVGGNVATCGKSSSMCIGIGCSSAVPQYEYKKRADELPHQPFEKFLHR
jgi:hypothetical protein